MLLSQLHGVLLSIYIDNESRSNSEAQHMSPNANAIYNSSQAKTRANSIKATPLRQAHIYNFIIHHETGMHHQAS